MADERRARRGNWLAFIIMTAIVVLIFLFMSRRTRGPAGVGPDVDTTIDTPAVVPRQRDTVDTVEKGEPRDTERED